MAAVLACPDLSSRRSRTVRSGPLLREAPGDSLCPFDDTERQQQHPAISAGIVSYMLFSATSTHAFLQDFKLTMLSHFNLFKRPFKKLSNQHGRFRTYVHTHICNIYTSTGSLYVGAG